MQSPAAPEGQRRARRPRVLVSNRQDMPVNTGELVSLATRTLVAEGRGDVELSVSLVAPEEMGDLHLRYMGEEGPTEVLSFPLGEDGLLGDVVLCPAEAAQDNTDPTQELRLLVVHGVLHLLGYDHEEEADRAAMWERQRAYSGVAL